MASDMIYFHNYMRITFISQLAIFLFAVFIQTNLFIVNQIIGSWIRTHTPSREEGTQKASALLLEPQLNYKYDICKTIWSCIHYICAFYFMLSCKERSIVFLFPPL